jgi:hypothetical protein
LKQHQISSCGPLPPKLKEKRIIIIYLFIYYLFIYKSIFPPNLADWTETLRYGGVFNVTWYEVHGRRYLNRRKNFFLVVPIRMF